MKKIVWHAAALSFALLTGASGASGCGATPKGSKGVPEGTTLEFWITQDVSAVDFSPYREVIGWFGAREFYGSGYEPVTGEDGQETDPAYFVRYLVSAWPDYADGGRHITAITITDPAVRVYGLTVLASEEEFDDVLCANGYTKKTESCANGSYTWETENHFIVSRGRQDGERELYVYAPVSNRENIVF